MASILDSIKPLIDRGAKLTHHLPGPAGSLAKKLTGGEREEEASAPTTAPTTTAAPTPARPTGTRTTRASKPKATAPARSSRTKTGTGSKPSTATKARARATSQKVTSENPASAEAAKTSPAKLAEEGKGRPPADMGAQDGEGAS